MKRPTETPKGSVITDLMDVAIEHVHLSRNGEWIGVCGHLFFPHKVQIHTKTDPGETPSLSLDTSKRP